MKCRKCKEEIPDSSKFCSFCGAKQVLKTEKRKTAKRPNGTGTVYKLSGPRKRPWAAARNKNIIGYYETKTAALEALSRLSGRDIDERYNMTFAQVFAAWKAEHFREISASAKESYTHAYKLFHTLHSKKFRSLKTADFQEVIDQHFHKSYSMVSKLKQLLTQMSTWAMREEIITVNLAAYVRLPENVKKEKEIFTEEEIRKLAGDSSETAKIILMLICTGMRIGELFSLPLADCHDTYVIGGEKTEAGRNRVIPIRPEGRGYFAYFAAQAKGPLLLSGYTGQHIPNNFRRRDYYPLLDKLGIPRKSPHATRHTYASRARRDGVPPEILQKILGHADYTTTANIYVHTSPEELVAAVEGRNPEV